MYKLIHEWKFKQRNCKVKLPNCFLEKMKNKASKAYPKETGGTLVGYYSKDFSTAYVKNVLGVKRGAKRERKNFYRPPDIVDTQLKQIYEETKGRIHYLGEWHTHPNGSAIPSSLDLQSMKKIINSCQVTIDTPILIIIGGKFCEDHFSYQCILGSPYSDYINGNYSKLYKSIEK